MSAFKLECVHVDTCLPDYWGGHHLAHVQIPVHKGMTLRALKDALHAELNEGAVAGSDDRTLDSSDISGIWYKRAHAAVNRIKPATKGQRRFFMHLDEVEDEDYQVYAFFVFEDRNIGEQTQ